MSKVGRRPWRRCSSCSGICHWHDTDWVCDSCGDEWDEDHDPRYRAPSESTRILSVEDHGMWRGHRTWTVRIDGPTGRAQVSARDVDTREGAIAQALDTYHNRWIPTDEDREAMKRNSAALK